MGHFGRHLLCRLAASVLVIQSAGGCSPSTPSTSRAEAALRQAIVGQRSQNLNLREFRKTDGIPRQVNGVDFYSLEFAATVAVVQDSFFSSSGADLTVSDPLEVLHPRSWADMASRAFAFGADRPNWVFEGDVLRLGGAADFIKKESGWVLNGLAIARTSIDSSRRAPGHSLEALKAESATQAAARQRRLEELMSTATKHFEQGRYSDALSAVDSALAIRSDDFPASSLRQQIVRTMDILGVTK